MVRPEFLIAEILFRDRSRLLIAVVYRPPNSGYLNEFFQLFLELQLGYRHSLIFGDFNADMCCCTFDSQQVSIFVTSSGLYLVPYAATHHLRNSSTLLDLCIADDPGNIKEYGQHEVPFLSAHDLIYIKYGIKLQRRNGRHVICRDYRGFDETRFLSDIDCLNWTELLNSGDIDVKIRIFNSHLLTCYNRHVPLRERYFRNLPAPWLTDELRDAMRERDLARKAWGRKRGNHHYDLFRCLRNKMQLLVRLRHLGLIKARDVSGGLSCSVEELNVFFSRGLVRSDGEVLSPPSAELRTSGYDDVKFYWSYVTPLTIRRVLSCSKSNAIGADEISLKLIRFTLPYLMPIVEHLINFSLNHGVFPKQWKSALICPIPKIKNPTSVQHYRPISILPAMSMILERVVGEQICRFLLESDQLDPYQSAYRKDHSTQICLIRMLDEVRQAADRRMITVSVFIDFSKAFDRMDHSLLRKLKSLCFSNSAHGWIRSYLVGRMQATRNSVDGSVSSWSSIGAGVPQGSVLRPLLFFFDLSDFQQVLTHCKYNFYADDL
ncbi:uncharacterized protein LOC115244754 [Formica exsecta]|uniref:uncharacterized protein LOC115244754 n=1 Tax=Formica exsecta TaxID=72781 RepID=UPI00114239A5|nr:uncharacterized protein LOC115244754 [Formica exsecta]